MQNKQQSFAPAVISAGLFFIVTRNEACAHLIPEESVKRYYEGIRIADNCRDPQAARSQIIRDTFGARDAMLALPAPSYESLLFYLEYYDGPAKDCIKLLAARYLVGKPFESGPSDGGSRDRIAPQPKRPNGPQDVQTIDWSEVEAMA